MKSILKVLGVVSIVLVFITGCRSGIVQNIVAQPVSVKQNTTDDQMYKAIKTAGLSLGWQVRKVKPGLAEAQLYLRDHMAVVEIPYTKEEFSINYKNSSNLNYNAEKNTIHSNYNGWIQNLRNAITLQLSALE